MLLLLFKLLNARATVVAVSEYSRAAHAFQSYTAATSVAEASREATGATRRALGVTSGAASGATLVAKVNPDPTSRATLE